MSEVRRLKTHPWYGRIQETRLKAEEYLKPVRIWIGIQRRDWVERCSNSKCKSHFKSAFWFKVKAEPYFKPEEYFEYFEDLKFGSNAEIGPKGAFKMAFV
jgi:hypothetical protein